MCLGSQKITPKILIGFFALALSNTAFSWDKQVYRNCESETFFGSDFIVHIKYNYRIDGSRIIIEKDEGEMPFQTMINTGYSRHDFHNGYMFSYISNEELDDSLDSTYPEGTRRFTLWVKETSSKYETFEWIWDKKTGWGFDEVASGECFRIKGYP